MQLLSSACDGVLDTSGLDTILMLSSRCLAGTKIGMADLADHVDVCSAVHEPDFDSASSVVVRHIVQSSDWNREVSVASRQ